MGPSLSTCGCAEWKFRLMMIAVVLGGGRQAVWWEQLGKLDLGSMTPEEQHFVPRRSRGLNRFGASKFDFFQFVHVT